MIEAKNITKVFEKNEKHHKKILFNAVDDISLKVSEGEILGILGPNGAGKTTLLRMMGQLMKPTSGSVVVTKNDKEYKSTIDIKRNIGYLSGNTKLYGKLTTRELLTIIGNIFGMDKQELDSRIETVIDVLKMESFADNRIEKLSTGQTQRASIARCIIHNPDIYIFDEPTLGLDIISSSAILEFMRNEREKGKTVIYSTHYMEEAEYLCDKIIMLNDGKIIGEGSIDELKNKTGKNNLREIFMKLVSIEDILYEF